MKTTQTNKMHGRSAAHRNGANKRRNKPAIDPQLLLAALAEMFGQQQDDDNDNVADDDDDDDVADDDDNASYGQQFNALLPGNSPDRSPVADDTTTEYQRDRQAERKQSAINGQAASSRAAQEIAGIARNIGGKSGKASILVAGDAIPYVQGSKPTLAHCPQHDESKSKVPVQETQSDGKVKTVVKSCNLHDLTNYVVKPLLTGKSYKLAVIDDDGNVLSQAAELTLSANKGDTMMLTGKYSIRLPVEDATGKGCVVFEQAANALAQTFIRTTRNGKPEQAKQAKQAKSK